MVQPLRGNFSLTSLRESSGAADSPGRVCPPAKPCTKGTALGGPGPWNGRRTVFMVGQHKAQGGCR